MSEPNMDRAPRLPRDRGVGGALPGNLDDTDAADERLEPWRHAWPDALAAW